jgi:hypothetical protein
VSLHDNRHIDIAPAAGWLGNTQVTVKATNLFGYSVSQAFSVIVVSKIYTSFLPSVSR